MIADELQCACVQNSRQLVDLEYEQNAGITEEYVKDVVCTQLTKDGYSAKKNPPKAKGADIEGWSIRQGGIVVEAKGEGSRPEMFYNFFTAALGQIVMRMSERNTRYVVALPIHKKFVRLAQGVTQHARKKLNLEFWFIGTEPTRYSIHILYPDQQ